MYTESIGALGGFGGYATLDFYRNFLEIFKSDCERDYPHIYFDNDFTMPSRTRALLFNESYDEIVEAMVRSIKFMLEKNVRYIVLICGTAHYFLKDIKNYISNLDGRLLNIIEITGEKIASDGHNDAFIVAAEGALMKKLYDGYMIPLGIMCESPRCEEYNQIRYFIECVKRDNLTLSVIDDFLNFIISRSSKNIVLGCTEFPALINYCYKFGNKEQLVYLNEYNFYDPIKLVLEKIKKELK